MSRRLVTLLPATLCQSFVFYKTLKMRQSVSMSVFTAASFVILLLFSPLSLASALACPECEEENQPPPVVTTEPCHECEHPHNPPPVIITEPCDECEHQHTPPPVIVTETCDECEHHHPTPSPTPEMITSTISVCRRPSHSIFPYTSGSGTFYFSSCTPTTMWYTPTPSTFWYTQNATGGTCLPPSTIYQNMTVPRATSILTSVSTATVYRNGTAPPAQTVTISGSGGIMTVTTETCSNQGSAPVEFQTIVSTIYQSGSAPPAQTITITRPPNTQRVTYTSYASGSPPATVTIVTTETESVATDRYLPSTVVSTQGVTVTGTRTVLRTRTSLTTGES